MAQTDERIDHYISASREFARPVLRYLRETVHKACPEVSENIKWGFPHFEYKGKILCSMASFKEHCAFIFRLGSLMKDPDGLMETTGDRSGMGHFGRIKDLKDLPGEKVMTRYIREAMSLTEQGVQRPKPKRDVQALVVPDDFMNFLKKDKDAYRTFSEFSYSNQKDYLEWINEAKTPETRSKRISTAVEWLHEGKSRNWKYMR